MDKFYIVHGLNEFSTAPYGVLTYKDGKVELDEVKAYNRARRMLNAGCNMFRRLRTCPVEWGAPVRFDWTDEGYFKLLRRYCEILHQPHQLAAHPGPGAIVRIALFDGCSERWMYDSPALARSLMQRFFFEFKGMDYVRFDVGNEMNDARAEKFVREVVFPEFQKAGLRPFSYGAIYSQKDNAQEHEKQQAELFWDAPTMLSIVRQVHNVRDDESETLLEALDYFIDKKNGIDVELSVDGVFDGASEEDFAISGNGRVQRRPSLAQLRAAMMLLFKRMPHPLNQDGSPKYGMEWISKAVNRDDLAAAAIAEISRAYKIKFNSWPGNYDKYPQDWQAPADPEKPAPVEPVKPKGDNTRVWIGSICIVIALVLLALAIIGG